MDVVWGETAGVEGQLWLLAPILFILQVFCSVQMAVFRITLDQTEVCRAILVMLNKTEKEKQKEVF